MNPVKLITVFAIAVLIVNTSTAQNFIPQYNNKPNRVSEQKANAAKVIKQAQEQSTEFPDSLTSNLKQAFLLFNITMPHDTTLENLIDMSNSQEALNVTQALTSKQRDSLLTRYRDSLDNLDIYDSAGLARLNDKINEIKIYNTDEFLTQDKSPESFSITHIRKYSVDSFNNYLYNQNNVDVFQSAAIQNFGSSNTFINTELASFLFGPVRMGVGGTFTTKGDTSKDKAIESSLQKIIANGGAVNLNFSLPLLFYRTRKDQVHFGIFAQINNGINPAIDSSGKTEVSKDVLYTNQSGINIHFDCGSNDHKARLSFDFPFYYSWGSKNTYQQFSISDYSILKLQVGVVIGDLFNLHISGPLFSTSKTIQRTPFIASLQFSPSQVTKAVKK